MTSERRKTRKKESIHQQHHSACTSHERSKCRIATTLLLDEAGACRKKTNRKDKHFESVDSEPIPETNPSLNPKPVDFYSIQGFT